MIRRRKIRYTKVIKTKKQDAFGSNSNIQKFRYLIYALWYICRTSPRDIVSNTKGNNRALSSKMRNFRRRKMPVILRQRKYHQYFSFVKRANSSHTRSRKNNSIMTSNLFLKQFIRPWSPEVRYGRSRSRLKKLSFKNLHKTLNI